MDSFLTFLVAITLLTIAPGADTVIVIRNALRGGLADGLVTSTAICSGLFVHAAVSGLGISIIILQSAWMFTALKLLGAAYLLWLGAMTLWRANDILRIGSVAQDEFNPMRSVREGLLSNLLNPKPIVFYMAFLPQFIDPQAGAALLQSFKLAGIHFVISVIWLGVVAAMATQMRNWLRSDGVTRRVNQGLGLGLCGFGLALASESYRS